MKNNVLWGTMWLTYSWTGVLGQWNWGNCDGWGHVALLQKSHEWIYNLIGKYYRNCHLEDWGEVI